MTSARENRPSIEQLGMIIERSATHRKELEQLESMVSSKEIDQGTYERMVKELKEKYQEYWRSAREKNWVSY